MTRLGAVVVLVLMAFGACGTEQEPLPRNDTSGSQGSAHSYGIP